MKKQKDIKLVCPFCGAEIKEEIPEGLSIKKVVDTINKIKMVLKKNGGKPY